MGVDGLAEFRSTVTAPTTDFSAVADIIPPSNAPALYSTAPGKKPLSFDGLIDFVKTVDLRKFGLSRESVVCTAIPNGPEAAVCFWAFMSQCVFAPLNPALTVPEIEFELHDLPAAAMIVMDGDSRAAMVAECCAKNNVPVIYMKPSAHDAGLFTLSGPTVTFPKAATATKSNDLALVLHTSGTTKKPKIVPLTHFNIGHGIQFVATTLRRSPGAGHVNLNVMPLFHIHGLIANVGASMYSKTPVVCAAFMGGADFLERLKDPAYPAPTWYSAVPTMHEAILLEAEAAGDKLKHSLTLMRNCSAALLPPVSKRFLKAFGASSPSQFTVVPTYAMTESFPICSNPPHLEVKLSTVGPAMGPNVKILRGHPEDVEVEVGGEGEVCVQGECVTAGYLLREHMSADPNIEAYSLASSGVGKMLRTGDKGYIDADGYLQLVGRFKEIINCGGEKISPLELEDQLLSVEGVETCVCFAVPAELFGEVVGVACVTKAGHAPPKIDALRQALKISPRFRPQVLVHMDAIPKGPTGKPKRIGLAQMLNLPLFVDVVGPQTYTISGVGDKLGKLMLHTRIFTGEYELGPAWQYPLTITLEMDPDLDISQQSKHVLVVHDPSCDVLDMTVTTYDKDGNPTDTHPYISKEDAKAAVDYVNIRTADYGLEFTARTAEEGQSAEDFAADFYADDGVQKLHHIWRVRCHDTPPGRALRLLKVLDLQLANDPAAMATGK